MTDQYDSDQPQRRREQLLQLLSSLASEKKAWYAALGSPIPELSRVARAAYSRARDLECYLRSELEATEAPAVDPEMLRSGTYAREAAPAHKKG